MKEMSKICGKAIDRFPSEATIREMNTRRLSLSQIQVAETLSAQEDMCLLSDETPERSSTVEGFHMSSEDGSVYVLGLREMSNKSASTTLDTFKEILSDISLSREGATDAGKIILSKVTATMSDQAATQKCFNDLLQAYKNSIMPDVLNVWNDLSEKERSSCSKLNNFFCGLHLLINFAEVANQVLKKYAAACDELNTGEKKSKPGESSCVRFIRTTCKALGRRGDAKSGAYSRFRDYIYATLHENLRLEPFHGNRFNILFLNAGYVFYYKDEIVDFLENTIKERNRLLQSVLEDAKVPEHLAAAKALGLIEKFVTSPLWRIIESRCHILDMNDHYMCLLSFLNESSKDALPFLRGEKMPFPDHVPSIRKNTDDSEESEDTSKKRTDDAVLRKLLENSDYDSKTVEILQLLFAAWAIYLQRAVKAHLPGGEFDEPAEEIRGKTKSVPKHNKFSEAVFGILHNLTTHRPNASLLANEAYVMFSLNRTLDWLNEKSATERHSLVVKARSFGRRMQQRFKQRKDDIRRKRWEALERERENIARIRHKNMQEKERLTNDIVYYGLWQTEEEVYSNVKSFRTKKEWQKAFSAQLKFRKTVLQQHHEDKTLFNLSKDKKDLTLHQLTNNLVQLIDSTFSSKKEVDVVKKGNPLLVGKRVVHRFKEEDSHKNYHGTVIDTVRGFPEWYNIVYDGQDNEDIVYTFKLQEDYEKGDLRIVGESQVGMP